MIRFNEYITILEPLNAQQRAWVDQNKGNNHQRDELFETPPKIENDINRYMYAPEKILHGIKEALDRHYIRKIELRGHNGNDIYKIDALDIFHTSIKSTLANHLIKRIDASIHDPDELYDAERKGYLTNDVKKALSQHLVKRIDTGNHNNSDIRNASIFGYNDKDVADALNKKWVNKC